MQIEIKGLEKSYGEKKALQHFSVSLQPGIYGILGQNGAGKSTLMNLLTDNLQRDQGQILVDQKDILQWGRAYRKKVGYMPQQQGYYDELSAKAFLLYMAQLKEIPRRKQKSEVSRVLEAVNLSDVAKKKIGGFSGGMKQRVMLAQALLGEPELLILDEPTAGVDPKERIRLRNLIAELAQDKIILLATHIVSDIECIADQVLLMKNGELLDMDTPQALMQKLYGKVWEKNCTREELIQLQKKYPYGTLHQRKEGTVFRVVQDTAEEGFETVEEDIGLEDVYMYWIG